LLALFGFGLGLPKPSPAQLPQPPQQAGFSLLAHAFLDPERRPSIAVNVDVPHTSLIFLKKDRVFQSEYAVYVKVLNRKKKLVETAVLNESVVVTSYEETRSAKMSSKCSKRFQVAPGDYSVECSIEVKNTQRVFEKDVAVTVPEFLEAGIGVGKPRLFATDIDTSRVPPVLAQIGAYPAFGREEKGNAIFAELDKHPVVQFDVYTEEEKGDSVNCELYFEVVDEKKIVHAYAKRRVRVAGLQNQFIVYLDVDEWDPGLYVFHAKAVQPDPVREATSDLKFVLGYTRAVLTRRFDTTVAILSLIATNQEIEELENAPEKERPRVWESFWTRRDPSPGTEENEALEEHLRRVRYATENYSDAGSGWQSDRGKVYIKYGEPDHTEVKIDPHYQGEYLVWFYYEENLTFVFYDRFGLGEYRLTDTSQL
jgi:GWxTD domain-containing protein